MSTTTPSIPTTGTWNIDGVHSTANFAVKHNVVATYRAPFLGLSGSLEDGVLTGSVPVEGLQVSIPIFKEHLQGEGFFDAANHPNLTFHSTELHAHDDGNVHGSGELTIKGTTKPVQFSGIVEGPAEVTTADGSQSERLSLTLATTIDRREFGLEVAAATGWEVAIQVELELAKA